MQSPPRARDANSFEVAAREWLAKNAPTWAAVLTHPTSCAEWSVTWYPMDSGFSV